MGPNFACFWLVKFYSGKLSEIVDRHYKIRPTADHHEKFYADRPTDLIDLALEYKKHAVKHNPLRKLSFPGGLTTRPV